MDVLLLYVLPLNRFSAEWLRSSVVREREWISDPFRWTVKWLLLPHGIKKAIWKNREHWEKYVKFITVFLLGIYVIWILCVQVEGRGWKFLEKTKTFFASKVHPSFISRSKYNDQCKHVFCVLFDVVLGKIASHQEVINSVKKEKGRENLSRYLPLNCQSGSKLNRNKLNNSVF